MRAGERWLRIVGYYLSICLLTLYWSLELLAYHSLLDLEYLATTIILNAPDPAYGRTLGLNEADTSGFNTTNGGKTWKVDVINIHAHTFNL